MSVILDWCPRRELDHSTSRIDDRDRKRRKMGSNKTEFGAEVPGGVLALLLRNRNRPVLEAGGGVGVSEAVGEFVQLERPFERGRVLLAAPEHDAKRLTQAEGPALDHFGRHRATDQAPELEVARPSLRATSIATPALAGSPCVTRPRR